MKVSAQYAQEHFADILTAIDTGEEVELTRPGQPSLRLVAVRGDTAEPWIQGASAKIVTLQQAGKVHLGIGDLRIEPGTAAYARRVLELIYEQLGNEILPAPTISAISGGGLGVSWRAGAKEVEAVIYPDSTTSFLASKGDEIQSEDEFAGDKVSSLSDALRQMLQG